MRKKKYSTHIFCASHFTVKLYRQCCTTFALEISFSGDLAVPHTYIFKTKILHTFIFISFVRSYVQRISHLTVCRYVSMGCVLFFLFLLSSFSFLPRFSFFHTGVCKWMPVEHLKCCHDMMLVLYFALYCFFVQFLLLLLLLVLLLLRLLLYIFRGKKSYWIVNTHTSLKAAYIDTIYTFIHA